MEEITNLMNEANTAISSLENFIFENKKEKYINLKSITAFMNSQIEAAEMIVEMNLEEGYEEVKSKLNTVIAKCSELTELFKTRNNFIVIVDENDEIVAKDITYGNTQNSVAETPETPGAPAETLETPGTQTETLETPAETLVENAEVAPMNIPTEVPTVMEIPVDTTNVMNTAFGETAPASVPAIEIIDGPSEVSEQNEEIQDHQSFAPESQMLEAQAQVPEINIIDDKQAADYSKDLDVAAVDAFLGNNEQENALTL